MAIEETHINTHHVERDKPHTSSSGYYPQFIWIKDKLNIVRSNAAVDGRLSPKREVFDRTGTLLYALLKKGVKPKFINPSIEGGIVVEFENKGIYYMAEIDNEDDIVFLIRDEERTKAFGLNPENYLDQIIDRI